MLLMIKHGYLRSLETFNWANIMCAVTDFFLLFQQLRLLKVLSIVHSNVPSIGRRTMWGLSGLKALNLSHNKLTNVVDQNFEGTHILKYVIDNMSLQIVLNSGVLNKILPYVHFLLILKGLYSLTHLVLDDNLIKSMVSAAFRHIPQLETLSLRQNQIEGK